MSLLKTVSKHTVQDGTYEAIVLGYQEVEANKDKQDFVAVTLDLDNTTFVDRWYAARLQWLMSDLKAQFGLRYEDIDLETLLKHAMQSKFTVLVTEDEQYGTQINYAVESSIDAK